MTHHLDHIAYASIGPSDLGALVFTWRNQLPSVPPGGSSFLYKTIFLVASCIFITKPIPNSFHGMDSSNLHTLSMLFLVYCLATAMFFILINQMIFLIIRPVKNCPADDPCPDSGPDTNHEPFRHYYG